MAERDEPLPDVRMDAAELYREEIYTDRKVGTIRVLTPVKADGTPDPARKTLFVGETQMLTTMGALPLAFEIEAASLPEAVAQYGAAAKAGLERTMRDLQELRRQAASSIVIPKAGSYGPGSAPGSGKIQLP